MYILPFLYHKAFYSVTVWNEHSLPHHLILNTYHTIGNKLPVCGIITLSFDKELLLYDNLIPDLFGVPSNFGGPTILETAFEWIIFEPEGTVEKFSDETGVPVVMVEKYWKRLQLLAVLDEEHRTISNIAKEWLNRHPDGNISSFSSDLGFYGPDIKKLRSSPDNPFALRNDEIDPAIIIKWFEENPAGTLNKCSKDTGISLNYIVRTYQSLGIKQRRELIAERNVQIREWINTHPAQTRKEIASLFNVTAKTVGEIERKMKQNHVSCPPVEKPNKIKKFESTETDYIERIKGWIETHQPYGTKKACAKDTGINLRTVCNLWEKAGGDARQACDVKSEAKILNIVTGMANHPGARDIDCALALKDSNVRADRLPTVRYLVSKIAKWRTAHPDGSQEECARDLNMSVRRVVNMWPSATVWMEQMM